MGSGGGMASHHVDAAVEGDLDDMRKSSLYIYSSKAQLTNHNTEEIPKT